MAVAFSEFNLLSQLIEKGKPSRMDWAIRVVWISFRPSEPETWVRILHRPLFFTLLRSHHRRLTRYVFVGALRLIFPCDKAFLLPQNQIDDGISLIQDSEVLN